MQSLCNSTKTTHHRMCIVELALIHSHIQVKRGIHAMGSNKHIENHSTTTNDCKIEFKSFAVRAVCAVCTIELWIVTRSAVPVLRWMVEYVIHVPLLYDYNTWTIFSTSLVLFAFNLCFIFRFVQLINSS